jgi:hypothetical protein
MESKEVKGKGKNKQVEKNKETNKKVSKLYTGRDSVLINCKAEKALERQRED